MTTSYDISSNGLTLAARTEVAEATGTRDERRLRRLSKIRWSWTTVNDLLGDQNRVKVANATWLKRTEKGVTVKFFGTSLVHYKADGSVRIRTGGYDTVHTLWHLDAMTPDWVSMIRNQHDRWFVDVPCGRKPYRDGMALRCSQVN